MPQPPICAAICDSAEPWMEWAGAPASTRGRRRQRAVECGRGRSSGLTTVSLPLICLNRLVYKQGFNQRSWA